MYYCCVCGAPADTISIGKYNYCSLSCYNETVNEWWEE